MKSIVIALVTLIRTVILTKIHAILLPLAKSDIDTEYPDLVLIASGTDIAKARLFAALEDIRPYHFDWEDELIDIPVHAAAESLDTDLTF